MSAKRHMSGILGTGVLSDPPVNLNHLRTFVVVAELGTVSKAAEALRVTQPAVSRRINEFERQLGFKLFERCGRRLQLTAQGEDGLRDCHALLTHARAFVERARASRRRELQTLRVVATSWMIEGTFPSFLRQYSEHPPNPKIIVAEAPTSEHHIMLESGEAHLAVTTLRAFGECDDCFACFRLPHLHIAAAGAPSPGMTNGDEIEICDLVEHPLLLPKPGAAAREIFDAACRLAGVVQDIVFESATPHTLLALAEAGNGIAIVPSILQSSRSGLQFLRVTHKQGPLQIAPGVVWDKRRTPNAFAEQFSEILAGHMLKAFPLVQPVPNPPRNCGLADERKGRKRAGVPASTAEDTA